MKTMENYQFDVQTIIRPLRLMFHALTPKERDVFFFRNGLLDGQLHTLEETGKRLDVTRERVRQIETKINETLKWTILESMPELKEFTNGGRPKSLPVGEKK